MIGKHIVDARGQVVYVLCECNQWPHAADCAVERVMSYGVVQRVGVNDYCRLEAAPFGHTQRKSA